MQGGRGDIQSTSGHAKHTYRPLFIGTIQKFLKHPSTGSCGEQNADPCVGMASLVGWCKGVDELGSLLWIAVILEIRRQ